MKSTKAKPGYILLVDDVIDNLRMLTDMLENLGHDVQIALNGQEALDKIAQHKPDLILLDIQMPGMNGYEVCERIKDNPDTEDIPVIFLSALSDTANIIRGFDAGGVDYVNKPFKFKEVVARVQSQLAVSQQRREIEALRERDKQQFESLANIKNKFMYGTAHDLKNPLTGLLLYTQMLRSTPPGDKEAIESAADGIELAARKMQSLITDILDLAQMQVGDQMRRVELPLNEIVVRSAKNFDVLAKEKNITLHLEMPEDNVLYEVDNSYFERMLDNLISNAIKYTPENGDVRVKLCLTDDAIELSVEDTGLGIPPNDIPRLFEAFYRVKSPSHKKESGTGLGLSMVAAIAEEHNGTVSVDSIEREGSKFTIILPRY